MITINDILLAVFFLCFPAILFIAAAIVLLILKFFFAIFCILMELIEDMF